MIGNNRELQSLSPEEFQEKLSLIEKQLVIYALGIFYFPSSSHFYHSIHICIMQKRKLETKFYASTSYQLYEKVVSRRRYGGQFRQWQAILSTLGVMERVSSLEMEKFYLLTATHSSLS